jgi:TldD protein
MIMSGETPHRGFFERASSRFVFASGRRGDTSTSCECEWEIARIGSAKGWRKFSGPPPQKSTPRLAIPRQDVGCEQVSSVLDKVVSRWYGRLHLNYSSVLSNRITLNDDFLSPMRCSSVWAVAGSLRLKHRQNLIPIGWSGRGTGLEWLCTEACEDLLFLAEALDDAEALSCGTLPAVLAPPASAVLLHEAVGHLAEAPLRPVAGRIGHRIGAEYLDLTDHPMERKGAACYEFDDENVRCMGPTTIVKNGVLVAELHSQASAREAGTLSTGNGRAKTAWDDPIPRTSNLVCAPGKASAEELISNMGHGLHILRLANGINNGVSVQADVVLAERIDSGKHTGVFLSGGRIEDRCSLLTKVAELASDTKFHNNAMCGKAGQLLFDVGTCAPSLRLTGLRIAA